MMIVSYLEHYLVVERRNTKNNRWVGDNDDRSALLEITYNGLRKLEFPRISRLLLFWFHKIV